MHRYCLYPVTGTVGGRSGVGVNIGSPVGGVNGFPEVGVVAVALNIIFCNRKSAIVRPCHVKRRRAGLCNLQEHGFMRVAESAFVADVINGGYFILVRGYFRIDC